MPRPNLYNKKKKKKVNERNRGLEKENVWFGECEKYNFFFLSDVLN